MSAKVEFVEERVMDARQSLKDLQPRLAARKVLDVKFCFAGNRTVPPSHIQEDAATALKSFLDGKVRKLRPAGDSVRK